MLLRTLGGLGLEGSNFSRPKPLLLLAYLSLEGSKPRRYLADLFFMEAKDPLNSLSRALSYLRKEAPDTVEADNRKAWTTLDSDAAELLNLADKQAFEGCVELYGGPFVETLDLEMGAELEEWVYGTREYLAGRVREALLRIGEQEAAKGNLIQAASHAETAYTLTGAPELEPEHFERVYTLLSAGNSPRATEVRDEAEGYGIELGGSSQAAKAQFQPVSREEVEIPNNLPPPKTSFVGREQELGLIAEQLTDPDCRLLTLHGMGGIGKSRLAMQAAYEQLRQGDFKDGVFFVSLDALSSADLIPSSIAEALALELQGQEDTLAQVKRFIGKRRMLLVLDNFEHLTAAITFPSMLLDACLNLNILVTSREILNLQRESVLTLEGLPVPTDEALSLESAQKYEAVQLFSHRAKHARLNFILGKDNLPDILSICRLVDGSPLGLELATVWVKFIPVAELAKEIRQNLDFLATTARDIPDRHQNVRAAFQHSWQLLSVKEQEVLRKLAVFRGGFDRKAAAEVVGASIPVLASLLDKSLLRMTPGGRYDQHPLLFMYTCEKLAESSEDSSIQAKHEDYFLYFLEMQEKKIRTGKQKEALEAIDVELGNILRAAQTALEANRKSKLVTFMRLLTIDGTYFAARGHSAQSLKVLEEAIEASKSLGELETAHELLGKLGDTHYNVTNDLSEALNAYKQAYELAHRADNPGREAVFLSLIGVVQHRQKHADAQANLEKAYLVARTHHDDLALCTVLEQRAYIAGISGDMTASNRWLHESLEVINRLEQTGDVEQSSIDRWRFFALLNLGEVDFNLGSIEQSILSKKHALQIAEDCGNQVWVATANYDIGKIYNFTQNRSLAKEHLSYALNLFRQNRITAWVERITSFMEAEGYLVTH